MLSRPLAPRGQEVAAFTDGRPGGVAKPTIRPGAVRSPKTRAHQEEGRPAWRTGRRGSCRQRPRSKPDRRRPPPRTSLRPPPDNSPADAAPEGAAVVVTRHREHRFPGRRRPVQVRFGEEEFAAIELAAGRAGLTPTGYVGAVALAAAQGTVPPAPSQSREALTELMAARAQVRRFGGNVNQAVAALNSTGETPQWLAQAVELTSRAVRQVDAAAEQLMRRRGETRP